jgi:predicted membrane-bound spermidine synthase
MILLLASFAFFISGFAALVYQIVWQRLLVLPIGADVHSTTLIVAAFMAGLGCGSLAGGYLADRLSPSRNLLAFVGAELAVGMFGFFSRHVFYDWQYLNVGAVVMHPLATAAMVFFSLLWPTFWMGMSLPLLARGVAGGIEGAARRVGLLYGLNTLGAALGAFSTTWVLMPQGGLERGLRVAAISNLLAATAVFGIAFRTRIRGEREQPRVSVEPLEWSAAVSARPDREAGEPSWSFGRWAILYGIAGFQALSLEIIWFRLLGVMLKSSAFTFGTLLTIYLGGLGIGAALGSAALRHVRRPALAFLLLQAFIGLYAGASIAALVWMVGDTRWLPALSEYLAAYEPLDAAAAFNGVWNAGGGEGAGRLLLLYCGLPAVLVGPPTIAMGASFPLLQKVILTDADRVGRRVGLVLLANIVGSTLGSIATGWAALNWIGSAGSLMLMTALSGLFAAAAATMAGGVIAPGKKSLRLGGALAVVALVAWCVPDGQLLWARLHGSPPAWIVFGEDASGLSVFKTEPRTFSSQTIVFVNGIGQSWIPYGNVHSALGAVPAFVHPNPREAAIVGLGSGDTLYALAGRPELSRVTCVEIIRPQLGTLREWERRSGYPALATLLADPRIEHVYGDGRIHIMRSERRYDIIEADALRPTSAYSGHLYSHGYFELLRSRLAPGGLAVTWAPTSRVHDTFAAVFPHVLDFGDLVLGSNEPIRFSPSEVRSRLRDHKVKAYYAQAGIDVEQLLSPYLAGPDRTTSGKASHLTDSRNDLNEDLFPRDEFSVPRR